MGKRTTTEEILLRGNKTEHDSNFGQNGFDYITDALSHKNLWYAIKADGAADAVFATLTTHTGTNADGFTLKAGGILYGNFREIILTSGAVIAYRTRNQE